MEKAHTKRLRRQEREHDAVRWPVSLEHLALHNLILDALVTLCTNLFLCLAECQRLRLGEEVGEEDTVMLRAVDGVVGRSGSDEVGRDDLGALMDELVERVLAVGAGCSPNNGLRGDAMSARLN
jgi:hypothetical protein